CWLVVVTGALPGPGVLAFPAAGLVPLPVAAFPGVGVGDGLFAALVLLGFCAVAIVAMATTSARILISFIRVPFWYLKTKILYFPGTAAVAAGVAGRPVLAVPGAPGVAGAPGAPGAPGVAGGVAEGSRLKNVVAMQLATTVSPGAYGYAVLT